MQQLSIQAMDSYFESLLRRIPEERRALFERLKPQMEAAVRETIGGSGKVASWQEGSVGTKGGYAAVRPKAKTFYKGDAVGYVTNAITSGHKKAGGKGWVPGKRYYESSIPHVKNVLNQEIRTLEKRLKEAAGG